MSIEEGNNFSSKQQSVTSTNILFGNKTQGQQFHTNNSNINPNATSTIGQIRFQSQNQGKYNHHSPQFDNANIIRFPYQHPNQYPAKIPINYTSQHGNIPTYTSSYLFTNHLMHNISNISRKNSVLKNNQNNFSRTLLSPDAQPYYPSVMCQFFYPNFSESYATLPQIYYNQTSTATSSSTRELSENLHLASLQKSKMLYENTKDRKTNLFVFYVPSDASSEDLRMLFEKYGEVKSAHIPINPDTSSGMGYGFCQFANKKDAIVAMKALNGFKWKDKYLRVKFKTIKQNQLKKNTLNIQNENYAIHMKDNQEQSNFGVKYLNHERKYKNLRDINKHTKWKNLSEKFVFEAQNGTEAIFKAKKQYIKRFSNNSKDYNLEKSLHTSTIKKSTMEPTI